MKISRGITSTGLTLLLITSTTACTLKRQPDTISKTDYCGELYEASQNYRANSIVFRNLPNDEQTKTYLALGALALYDRLTKLEGKIDTGTIHWSNGIVISDSLITLQNNEMDLVHALEDSSYSNQEILAEIDAVNASYMKAIKVCPTNYKLNIF